MDIYDYDNKITIKFRNGKAIIETTPEILTVISNSIYDSAEYQQEHGWDATAEDRGHLFNVMYEKKNQAKGEKQYA